MLTIGKRRHSKALTKYFKEHLSVGDYYSGNEQVKGAWYGKLAERLGISDLSEVHSEDFEALANGIHPKTKKKLALRTRENRIAAFDMVFSAPKSVSIMAVAFQDERLVQAHEKAVALTLPHLEEMASGRVRRGLGLFADGSRLTGNFLAAQFTHDASRELDPQLHTHAIIFNTTYDPVEKRLKALDSRLIYDQTKYLTEIYRNELATLVRKLGYSIETGKHCWRVKGVPIEIEKRFSKRGEEIKKIGESVEAETGLKMGNDGLGLISLTSRSSKKEIDPSSLVMSILGQMSEKERGDLASLKMQSQSIDPSVKIGQGSDVRLARAAIDYAMEYVFQMKSVVQMNDLIKVALKRSAGLVSYSDIKLESMDKTRFMHRGTEVTTRAERDREVRLLNYTREGLDRFNPLNLEPKIDEFLTPEQKYAVKRILSCQDQVMSLRGGSRGWENNSNHPNCSKSKNPSHSLCSFIDGIRQA